MMSCNKPWFHEYNTVYHYSSFCCSTKSLRWYGPTLENSNFASGTTVNKKLWEVIQVIFYFKELACIFEGVIEYQPLNVSVYCHLTWILNRWFKEIEYAWANILKQLRQLNMFVISPLLIRQCHISCLCARFVIW